MKPELDFDVALLLDEHCGFSVLAKPSGLLMLPASEDLPLVAGDGAGGCFYEWRAEARDGVAPIVYLTSYGETSRFADSFADALLIVTAFPEDWHDGLVAAWKSEELFNRVIERSEESLDPDLESAREEIRSALGFDLSPARGRFFSAIHRQPPFVPTLQSEDGAAPALSFADRPSPK